MKVIEVSGIIVGIIAGIFGVVWGIFTYILPSSSDTQLNPDICGIWLSNFRYPASSGYVEVNGTTEYFMNGNYNFVGQITLFYDIGNNSIQISYNIDGTGEWIGDSNFLIIKLIDFISHPASLICNAQQINVDKITEVTQKKLPDIEEFLPKGVTEEYKIVSLNNNQMILEVDAPNGNLYEIIMKKQNKRFQRKDING